MTDMLTTRCQRINMLVNTYLESGSPEDKYELGKAIQTAQVHLEATGHDKDRVDEWIALLNQVTLGMKVLDL